MGKHEGRPAETGRQRLRRVTRTFWTGLVVIGRHPVLWPIPGICGAITVSLAIGVLTAVTGSGRSGPPRPPGTAGVVALVATALLAACIVTVASLVSVDVAGQVLRGVRPGLAGSVVRVLRGRPAVLTFVLAPVAAGLIILGLAALGNLVHMGGGIAGTGFAMTLVTSGWPRISYLLPPVMITEGLGLRAGARRVRELYQQAWGSLSSRAYAGILLPGWLLSVIPVAGASIWMAGHPESASAVTIALIAWAVFSVLLIGTVQAVCRAALYRFAVDGSVMQPFSGADLRRAFG